MDNTPVVNPPQKPENPPANPYDILLEDKTPNARTTLRRNGILASDANPDQTAKALGLSKATGVPVGVVERNLRQVEQRFELNEYDRLLKNHPKTANFFITDPVNLRLAKDDAENMGRLEVAAKSFAKTIAKGFGAEIPQGLMDIGYNIGRFTDSKHQRLLGDVAIIQEIDRRVALNAGEPSLGLLENMRLFNASPQVLRYYDLIKNGAPTDPETMEERLQIKAEVTKGLIDNWASHRDLSDFYPYKRLDDFKTWVDEALPISGKYAGTRWESYSQGAASFVTFLAMLLVTKSPATTAVAGSAQMTQQARDEALAIEAAQPNLDMSVAAVQMRRQQRENMAIASAFPGLLESIPGMGLVSEWGMRLNSLWMRALAKGGIGAISEGSTEAVQQVMLNEIARLSEVDPNRSWKEGVWQSAETGGAVSLPISLGYSLIDSLLGGGKRGHHAPSPSRMEAFESAVKLAQESKLRERAPERFEAFAQSLAGTQEVFVPAETLRSFFQTLPPEQAQAMARDLGVEDQLAIADAAGADIVIPAARYLAVASANGVHEALRNDIRLDIGGLSIKEETEAKALAEKLLAEAGPEIEAQMAEEAKAEEPARRVYEDFVARLTAAGAPAKTIKATAALAAARYAARGERLGIDAWEAYQLANLDVRSVPEGLENLTGQELTAVLAKAREAKGETSAAAQPTDSANPDATGEGSTVNAESAPADPAAAKVTAASEALNKLLASLGLDAASVDERQVADILARLSQKQETSPAKPQSKEGGGKAFTSAGRAVDVQYEVVEASSLVASHDADFNENPAFPSELQPRDRTKAAYQAQVMANAAKLNPELLGESPLAAHGAPVVGEDGIVESGNGRVMALRRAYAQHPERAAAYRAHIESLGHSTEGMKEPVLIRRRVTPMSMEERSKFASEANAEGLAAKSATETALDDARHMQDGVLDLYKGGDFSLAKNADFVRAVMEGFPEGERAALMDAAGNVNEQGLRRIEAAMLAKAYGNARLIAKLIESTDNDIKAIGGALLDVAPIWARMRARAAEGKISPAVDATADLLEAVRLVEKARADGMIVSDVLNQTGMFDSGPSDTAKAFLGLFFRDEKLRRAAGRASIEKSLADYVAEAEKQVVDLFGKKPLEPVEILAGLNQQAALLQSSIDRLFQDRSDVKEEAPRGRITFGNLAKGIKNIIDLFKGRDESTVVHELVHAWRRELEEDAARPDAPQQVKDDWAQVQGWLVAKPGEKLNKAQEEKWARGGETYLFEGIAPSIELQGVFERFRRWLLRIYRTIRNLDAPLTPEIRAVFDRLLATDAQIAAKAEAQKIKPAFATAEEAKAKGGMSAPQFEAYLKKFRAIEAKRNERVLAAAMKDIERRKTKEWKEEEAKIKEEIRAQFAAMRDWAALQSLGAKDWPKLDRAAVAEVWNQHHEAPGTAPQLSLEQSARGIGPDLPRGVTAKGATSQEDLVDLMTDEGGLHPDLIAPLLGYDTGYELLRDLAALEAQRKELRSLGDPRSVLEWRIDEESHRRMIEKHGDALNDGTIEREAMEAVHSEDMASLMIDELRALGRQSGAGMVPPSLEAIRDWAKQQIAGMKSRDGSAAGRFLRAERQAGREAQQALLVKETPESLKKAFQAKQRQVVNHMLYMEAKKAAEEVGKATRYLRRLAALKTARGIDQDYLDQIHGLLERFDFRQASGPEVERRKNLATWIAEREADGQPPTIPDRLRDAAFRKHYSEMTVSELMEIRDAVKNIEHLGRLKKELLAAKEKREFDEAASAMADGVREHVPEHGRLRGSWKDRWLSVLRGFLADHRKLENLAIEFDGGKRGSWWRTLYEPLNRAGDEEASMKSAATRKLSDLFGVFTRAEKKRMATRENIPELGRVMSRWDLIALALNMGNEGNIDALIRGNGYSPEALRQAIGRLSKKELDFVQSIWDYVDSFWPQIAALERDMNGVAPEKVAPLPLITRHGIYRGGYYPIKGDPAVSPRKYGHEVGELFKQMMGGGSTRAATRHGHTIERVGFGANPVNLDIGVLFGHINDVIHDLTHRKAVVDAHRLLTDARVVEALNATAGHEVRQAMDETIRAIAAGNIAPRDSLERIVGHLRGGFVISRMGLNLVNAVQNVTGLFPAIALIGEKRMAMHALPLLANPAQLAKAWRWAAEQSPMMAERLRNSSRDMREIMDALDPRKEIKANVTKWAMAMPAFTDQLTATIAWTAAYNKAMAGEAKDAPANNHEEAVSYADSTIRQSMGAGLSKDLANIQRGSEYKRLLTSLMGYFNTIWNLNVSQVKGVRRGQIHPLRFLLNMLLINTIPMALGRLIASGPPDEDEEWWEWMLYGHLSWISGGLAGVRDVVSAATGWAPSDALDAFNTAIKGVTSDGASGRTVARSAVDIAGIGLQLPSRQAFKTADGLYRALVEGEDLSLWEMLIQPPPKR